jgi:nicotinamide-nucleotide amidase
MTSTQPLCEQISVLLQKKKWMLTTAESCTGGLIAAACTDLAGSSRWFERGFITYSNTSKSELLSIPLQVIIGNGAVSEAVVRAMATGAVANSNAQVSLAVTGIAGPDGGSADKPVGTVWFGWCIQANTYVECRQFIGNRTQVREATVLHSLTRLITFISS